MLRAIAGALGEALAGTTSAEERASIARIERRRRALLTSRATIAVIDFGAGGNSRVQRTAAQMKAGVAGSAPVRTIARASKGPAAALLLFKLVRHLQPTSCIELGSCVGISAAYQAAALDLNRSGQLQTLEGSPAIAAIARDTLAQLGIHRATVVEGPFHETYGAALRDGDPVDFLFNDGHHDRGAMLRYFAEAVPHLAREALLVFDDIRWSEGTYAAWEEIISHARVTISIDLGDMGLAVVSETTAAPRRFRIPL